jgi:AraC-like DNA-binding protein/quercetin dioxygenase-like cupin family protein
MKAQNSPPQALAAPRSTRSSDYQHAARVVAAMPTEEAYGEHVPPHAHTRAQLMYAVEGLIRVSTEFGVWILPPKRALLIAPGVVHEVSMLSKVSLRLMYIAPEAAAFFGPGCRVIEVSPLLRELIVALAAEPVEYTVSGRGGHLAMLILSELESAETVPIAIPWPRDRRLVAVCSAIMQAPGTHRSIEAWAADAGASARTLIRLFPKETGLHYRQWLQQVHLAEAFCRLARGDSVGVVARALGYASPSAFTSMFHRLLGKTPLHYLNEWRGQPTMRLIGATPDPAAPD